MLLTVTVTERRRESVAAACFDPISSHGVGAALDAGIAAAEAVARSLDGDGAGLDTYDRRMRHGFARYLRRWQEVYRQEDRWSEALFWRRRHAAAEPPAPG